MPTDPVPGPSNDVFLSHASEDKPEVRVFAKRLQNAGLKVWLDEEQLPPGHEPRDAIQKGMKDSRHVLVWITKNWLHKTWTQWELKLFSEAQAEGQRVIPILWVEWDEGELGPYLTKNVAVNRDVDDDERLWLAFCGIKDVPPGEHSRWAEQGKSLAAGTIPLVEPAKPRAVPTPAPDSREGAGLLWQLHDPSRVVIVVSNSSPTETGEYVRPATGIGQVRALAYSVPSLSRAYRDLELRNIYLSTDQLQERREDDLIVLGGPKNNSIARDLLDELRDDQPARQEGSELIWRKRRGGEWVDEGADTYRGEVRDQMVRTDFGLILRVANPFASGDRTAVLLSGSHTHGTMAAAKFFAENLLRELPGEVGGKNNLAVLVECHVSSGYPSAIRIKESYSWPRPEKP